MALICTDHKIPATDCPRCEKILYDTDISALLAEISLVNIRGYNNLSLKMSTLTKAQIFKLSYYGYQFAIYGQWIQISW
jgi:hypothetical protein